MEKAAEDAASVLQWARQHSYNLLCVAYVFQNLYFILVCSPGKTCLYLYEVVGHPFDII